MEIRKHSDGEIKSLDLNVAAESAGIVEPVNTETTAASAHLDSIIISEV